MRSGVHRLDAFVALIAADAFCICLRLGLIDPVARRTSDGLRNGSRRWNRGGWAVAFFGSSKSQTPKSKEAPSSKHQAPIPGRAGVFLNLEFGTSLVLGVWSLVLPRSHWSVRQRDGKNSAIKKIIHVPRRRPRKPRHRSCISPINILVSLSRDEKPDARG